MTLMRWRDKTLLFMADFFLYSDGFSRFQWSLLLNKGFLPRSQIESFFVVFYLFLYTSFPFIKGAGPDFDSDSARGTLMKGGGGGGLITNQILPASLLRVFGFLINMDFLLHIWVRNGVTHSLARRHSSGLCVYLESLPSFVASQSSY